MAKFSFFLVVTLLVLCGVMVVGDGEKDSESLDSSNIKNTRKKTAKKKSTKDWTKLKEEDLEKEWEEGDEEPELEVIDNIQ